MEAPQASAVPVTLGKPIRLYQAFLLSLGMHGILVLLFFLGLLSELFEPPVVPQPEPRDSVRFTFAPREEPEPERAAEEPAGTDLPVSPTPPTPEPTAQPEPEEAAPVTLGPPQPRVVPVPGPAVDEAADPPRPEEPDRDAAPAEREQAAETLRDESISEEAQRSIEGGLVDPADGEAEPAWPRSEDGERSPPAAAETPGAAPRRAAEPSLDQRLSAFSRAVERARAAPQARPERRATNVFEPDWPNLPTTGQALGNLTFESGDFDWEDYGRQIYWIIWRTWHNRLLARVDDFEKWAQQTGVPMLDHANAVRFTIERNGEISSIVLEMDSGVLAFDLSATEALDEALLPPLPADFPRDREIVHAQFIGYGPIGNMRRGLQEYKRRGWF